MRVANLSVMELVIEVNETDVVNVSLGDRARIVLDALPDETFAGASRRSRRPPGNG
jgi:HlyD family secretion protein